MQGKIVKGIAGFYYVYVVESGLYECKAKGIFRKDKMKPLVGDNVEIDVISEADKKGNVAEILPRLNTLIRLLPISIRPWLFFLLTVPSLILICWIDF